MLAKQAFYQWNQRLTRLRQYERMILLGPLQLKAGRECGDPDLADRCVGSYHKLAGAIVKDNVHHTIVVFKFEACPLVFCRDEGLFQ